MEKQISLKVNGEDIPLSEFPAEMIIYTIFGMMQPLKGVDEIKEVEIKIHD